MRITNIQQHYFLQVGKVEVFIVQECCVNYSGHKLLKDIVDLKIRK